MGTDGGAVLNDADVGSAVKGGSKTFGADELVVRNTRFLNADGNIDWEKGTPYEQRSLPYIENPNAYHRYEVIKPIENVTMSEIAPAFEQAGGGIQYELPYNIKKLRELGYIKEIK